MKVTAMRQKRMTVRVSPLERAQIEILAKRKGMNGGSESRRLNSRNAKGN